MAKRVSLGVKKKRPIKRSKNRFLKKLFDYLASDSHMFAPLISPPSSDSSADKEFCSSASDVETISPLKQKNKKLLKKVEEYLKSDSYLYAPVVDPSPPSTGPFRYFKRVTTEIIKAKTIENTNQLPEQAKVIEGLHVTHRNPAEETISGQKATGHSETLKHVVRHNCRSSIPGTGMLESGPWKLVD